MSNVSGQFNSMYSAKEEARGYAVNMKRIVLAYSVEALIVITSLIGAWLFAKQYGHNDFDTMLMMMLGPIAFAVVEFCRIPLAIATRMPSFNVFLKSIIVLALVGAAFVTVKSVSQLGEMMFRPRLYDVVHARERLAEAEGAVTLTNTRIADADALVAQRTKELDTAEQGFEPLPNSLQGTQGKNAHRPPASARTANYGRASSAFPILVMHLFKRRSTRRRPTVMTQSRDWSKPMRNAMGSTGRVRKTTFAASIPNFVRR